MNEREKMAQQGFDLCEEIMNFIDTRIEEDGLEEAVGYAALADATARFVARRTDSEHTVEEAMKMALESSQLIAQMTITYIGEIMQAMHEGKH